MLADPMSGESLPSGLQIAVFSLSPHMAEKRTSPHVLSYKALITFMRVPASWPNYLLEVPPPNTITLGLEFQHMDLEYRGRHI